MNGIYSVFLIDQAGNRLGMIDDWKRLEVVKRYNDVGKILLEVGNGNTFVTKWMGKAFRLTVYRKGKALASGMIASMFSDGTMTRMICDDDVVLLRWRLGLPVPEGPPFDEADYDVRTGVAETVMKTLLWANTQGLREMDGLQIAPTKGRGSSIELKARFDNLLDLMQTAGTHGGVRFDVVNGEFDISVPKDVSNQVTFSYGNGNLLRYELQLKPPKGNYCYVLGEGELSERAIFEGGREDSMTAWGRREFAVDARRLTTEAGLTQALASSLDEREATIAIEASCVDSPVARFGEDYDVGSKVKVLLPEMKPLQENVKAVRFVFDAENGETVQPTIGSLTRDDASGANAIFVNQRKLSTRLENLERQ